MNVNNYICVCVSSWCQLSWWDGFSLTFTPGFHGNNYKGLPLMLQHFSVFLCHSITPASMSPFCFVPQN